jgi:hypothetical protein
MSWPVKLRFESPLEAWRRSLPREVQDALATRHDGVTDYSSSTSEAEARASDEDFLMANGCDKFTGLPNVHRAPAGGGGGGGGGGGDGAAANAV